MIYVLIQPYNCIEFTSARVGHVGVNPRAPVPVWPRTSPAGNGFIVAHILIAESQIIHASLHVTTHRI